MNIPQMHSAILEIQDAMVVMAHLEKEQSERIAQHHAELRASRERFDRIEQNLVEITDKLNGLIGYMDNQARNGGKQ